MARLKSCPDTKVRSQASQDQTLTKASRFFVLILCYRRSQDGCFTPNNFGRRNFRVGGDSLGDDLEAMTPVGKVSFSGSCQVLSVFALQ